MVETDISHEADDYLGRTERIAANLARIRTELIRRESVWSLNKRKEVMGNSFNLIKIVEAGILQGLTLKQLHALQMTANGARDRQIADEEGVSKRIVNDRKNTARNLLGARTIPQAVVEAIMSGLIGFEAGTGEPPLLTPLESRILQGYALGRTSQELASMYGLDNNTVTSRQDGLREKLGAKNQVHAMKRAFELGVFKKEAGITDPEIFDQSVLMKIDGLVFDYRAAGIKHPDHIEMLVALTQLDKPIFSFDEIKETDFYMAAQERGRRIVFGKAMNSFMVHSKNVLAEEVVERQELKKRGTKYALRKPISVVIGEEEWQLPYTDEPIRPPRVVKPHSARPKPKPKPRVKPKDKKIIKPKMKVEAPEEVKYSEIPETVDERTELPTYTLSEEEIPSIQDALDSLNRRKRTDTETAVRQAMHQISVDNFLSYNEKLVAALRYGVSFSTLGLGIIRRTNGEVVDVGNINAKLPVDNVGLKLESVAAISGLSPYGVLDLEEALLSRNIKNYPILKAKLEHIRIKKERLLKVLREESA